MNNNQTNKTKQIAVLVLDGVLILALSLYRCLFFLDNVDPSTLFISFDACTAAIYAAFAVTFAVIIALAYFVGGKTELSMNDVTDRLTKVGSFVMIPLFVAYFIVRIMNVYSGDIPSLVMQNDAFGMKIIIRVANYLGLVFAPFAVWFYSMRAFGKKTVPSSGLSILSNAPAVCFAMYLLEYFVKTSSYVNRAGRSLEVIAYSLMVLFFVYESRLFTPKPSIPATLKEGEKPDDSYKVRARSYAAFAFVTSFACLFDGISDTLLSLVGFFDVPKDFFSCAFEIIVGLILFAKGTKALLK